MIIIYGSRLYGRVDVVPGMFHVATMFLHIYYIPVYPMQSFIVQTCRGGATQELSTPIHRKSVVFAYLRALTVLATLVGALMMLTAGSDPGAQGVALATLVGSVLFFGLVFFFWPIFRASRTRACALADELYLNPVELARFAAINRQPASQGFGVVTAPTGSQKPSAARPRPVLPTVVDLSELDKPAQPPSRSQSASAPAADADVFADWDDWGERKPTASPAARPASPKPARTTFWIRGTQHGIGEPVCLRVVAADGKHACELGRKQGIDVATVQYQDGRLAMDLRPSVK